MSLALEFRPQAEDDVHLATAWYAADRLQVARLFLESLDDLLRRIQEAPIQVPTVSNDVRRGLMKRFPYGVFFKVMKDRVVILGVLHLHRNPATWRTRR